MKASHKKAFAAVIILAATALALIVSAAGFSSCKQIIDFSQSFYYVCYDSPDDANSASSISSAVESYGGAGYIIKNDRKYFVTVACYYSEKDAETVCSSIKAKGLPCKVMRVDCGNYYLKGRSRVNAEKYAGNLNTLTQLSVLLYGLANSLDNCTVNQDEAKAVLADFKQGLDTLIKQNRLNCFTDELSRLSAEFDDVSNDYILSREVRRLQITVTDAVANIRLY